MIPQIVNVLLLLGVLFPTLEMTDSETSPPPSIVQSIPTRTVSRVTVPEEVNRGEVLTVSVTSGELSRVLIRVTPPDRGTIEVPALPLGAGESGLYRWYGNFGLDHGLPGGEILVEIALVGDATVELIERRVLLVERSFQSERIALNYAISALRQTDDPLRTAQSAELWQLLQRFDRNDRYHGGVFDLPLRGALRQTSGFGDRRVFLYVDGGTARSVHNGLDWAAPVGTPVFAPGRGRVVMAQDRMITGGTVILVHQPGLYTLYYHLHSVDVDVDEIVEAGRVIGTVGSTGVSTGPHLHWEFRLTGAAVDPAWFLRHPIVDTRGLVGALSTLP